MIKNRTHRHRPVEELNITAFMNLMVILVPFLLITAVFSRLAILELNIPAPSDEAQNDQDKPSLQLEITIRENALIVADGRTGPIQTIENDESGYRFTELAELLKKLKTRFPEIMDSTLLSEPNVPYSSLIRLMDTVRIASVVKSGSVEQVELFPIISVGDASVMAQGAAQ